MLGMAKLSRAILTVLLSGRHAALGGRSARERAANLARIASAYSRAELEAERCRWFDGQICQAGRVATGEVAMASAGEGSWPRLNDPTRRRDFDCPRAHECSWQQQSPGGLCSPRRALAHGLDPRHCR